MNSSYIQTLTRFIRFGFVGASGIVVDMGVLFLLADHRTLALSLTLSKMFAAETAIINNFVWNDLWTFQDIAAEQKGWSERLVRFGRFNLICLAGIVISIALLDGQVHFFHLNLYLANLIAIVIASLWNFWMNLKFGWVKKPASAITVA